LLTSIDGVAFTGCWARRETVTFDGLTLNLIGLDDFKANQRAAGRLKDLANLLADGTSASRLTTAQQHCR
jgi:hypothetical protein